MTENILRLSFGRCWGVFGFLLRVTALAFPVWPACRAQAQDQVLSAITNFTQTGPIVVSAWPADLRVLTNASLYSWRTNVFDAETGRQVYRLTMATNFPWQWTNTSGSTQKVYAVSVFVMTGWDYLPPETDELRIRVKVVSGRFQLAMGCINLAFAPSDAYTDIRVLDESTEGWQTVRFSLHKHLIRNYRRNDFTKQLPYINITRWIQEPSINISPICPLSYSPVLI